MKPRKSSSFRIRPGQMNLSGQRIRVARLSHNPRVLQEQLVSGLAKFGVFMDRSALSRVECHQRGVMDLELKAIAVCLDTTAAALIGEKVKAGRGSKS